ncbi:DUF3048 domain-containing protein [Desnuesiella massiliensis]|uniref:DUF3048 domain-containing protein n=1 Tax=Desnuesiella massiliensis TaxID=1650662 RepID=UPI0006E329BA|nr:DUF3048 domain-containing protein [Desnuesiella massiliensis]
MKNKLLLIGLVTASIAFSSCNIGKKSVPSLDDTIPTFNENISSYEKQNQIQKFFLPYTGEETSKENADKVAFMAIIENSTDSRPQSGISKADFTFETMAEGGIPRFISLFQKNTVKEIGPIRSARSYFIDISKEFKLPFAHCGGSEDALNSIKAQNLISLNEMTNGSYYWRDKTRKAPHNLYTSSEKLIELIKKKNYTNKENVKIKFDSEYWGNDTLPKANMVKLTLNRFYNTHYEFQDGRYMKYMDNVKTIDKAYNEPVAVKNVVIQKTSITLNKDKIHVDIPLVGKGEGYVISNGKYQRINWFREGLDSPTILKDLEGKEVPLSEGNTWWNIIDKNNMVDIK